MIQCEGDQIIIKNTSGFTVVSNDSDIKPIVATLAHPATYFKNIRIFHITNNSVEDDGIYRMTKYLIRNLAS